MINKEPESDFFPLKRPLLSFEIRKVNENNPIIIITGLVLSTVLPCFKTYKSYSRI